MTGILFKIGLLIFSLIIGLIIFIITQSEIILFIYCLVIGLIVFVIRRGNKIRETENNTSGPLSTAEDVHQSLADRVGLLSIDYRTMTGILTGILYTIGLALAGYAGATGLFWGFIFLSAFIMLMGYYVARAPQQYRLFQENGLAGALTAAFFTFVTYSIVTGIVYFPLYFFIAS
jgi:hypothetical protein